jgi:hypothetical protein
VNHWKINVICVLIPCQEGVWESGHVAPHIVILGISGVSDQLDTLAALLPG